MKYNFTFTAEEANQLLSYAEQRDQGNDSGWYYGNKGAFETRHKRIIAELNNRTRQSGSARAPHEG